jgi:hypothetical protein
MTSGNTPRRRTTARRTATTRPARRTATAGGGTPPPASSRPARLVEREAPYLIDELKRVAIVTSTCVGLLLLLTVVDRMR